MKKSVKERKKGKMIVKFPIYYNFFLDGGGAKPPFEAPLFLEHLSLYQPWWNGWAGIISSRDLCLQLEI